MTFNDALDRMFSDQEHRLSWIPRAAKQIRQWREEDERNGQPWGETFKESGDEL